MSIALVCEQVISLPYTKWKVAGRAKQQHQQEVLGALLLEAGFDVMKITNN